MINIEVCKKCIWANKESGKILCSRYRCINIDKMIINRGDIFFANLNPVIGSEQGGVRPVIIIQNNLGNLYSDTVIVASISTKNKKMPTHVAIKISFLPYNSYIYLEQIRTIAKTRLIDYVGCIHGMSDIDQAIKISLGL